MAGKNVLRQTLRAHGITQAAVAEHLGVTEPTLSKRIHGAIRWTTDEAAALVAFLRSRGVETTMDALFGEEAA